MCSEGKRRCKADTTVNPPKPESKTPMGAHLPVIEIQLSVFDALVQPTGSANPGIERPQHDTSASVEPVEIVPAQLGELLGEVVEA